MKDYQKRKDLLAAVETLGLAWLNLNSLWTDDEDGILNSLKANEQFPFAESFDDMESKVCDWVNAVQNELGESIADATSKLAEAKKRIISVTNSSQGSGNTVLIYKFLSNNKKLRWLYLSENYFTIVSFNYLEDPDWYDNQAYDEQELIIDADQIDCLTNWLDDYWIVLAAMNEKTGGNK
jgi:hypothetical protein